MNFNSIVNCLDKGHLPLVNIGLPLAKNQSDIKWDTVIEKAQTLSVSKNFKNNIQNITIKTQHNKEIIENIPIINILISKCDICGKQYQNIFHSNL
jgi:hypothetical protein